MENKKDFEWKPWEDAKNHEVEVLAIDESPCGHCVFFQPRVEFISSLTNGGVFPRFAACTALEMFSDFSCFEDGDDEK